MPIRSAGFLLLALASIHCGKGSNDKKQEGKAVGKSGETPSLRNGVSPGEVDKSAQPPQGPTGTIKGTVSITGEIPEMPLLRRGADPKCDNGEMRAETILTDGAGGLANVVVRIKPGTVPAFTPSAKISVDQNDCMYRPRVQGGVVGQTVEVTNSDKTTHNVHARHLPLGKRQGIDTIINKAQPAGVSMTFELGDEPVAKLKCDYHGWMQGYVVVSDNPYFSVSGKDGSFEIKGVPTGTMQVEAWHEYLGMKQAELVVDKDGVATLEIKYDMASDDPMAGAQ